MEEAEVQGNILVPRDYEKTSPVQQPFWLERNLGSCSPYHTQSQIHDKDCSGCQQHKNEGWRSYSASGNHCGTAVHVAVQPLPRSTSVRNEGLVVNYPQPVNSVLPGCEIPYCSFVCYPSTKLPDNQQSAATQKAALLATMEISRDYWNSSARGLPATTNDDEAAGRSISDHCSMPRYCYCRTNCCMHCLDCGSHRRIIQQPCRHCRFR